MAEACIVYTGQRGEIGRGLAAEFARRGRPLVDLDTWLRDPAGHGTPRRLLHLAGRANEAAPAALIDANVDYLRRVIAIAEEAGIGEVIFFSSAAVYGNADREAVAESDPLAGPGLYGASKLVGEKLVEKSRLRSLCLRLPGVLELRKATNFVSRTFEQLHRGETVVITNGGRVFNNFIDLGTLADFVFRVGIERPHDVINLASARQLKLIDLITLIRKNLGDAGAIEERGPSRPFFNLSIARAAREYGFVPGDAPALVSAWCAARAALKEQPHVRSA